LSRSQQYAIVVILVVLGMFAAIGTGQGAIAAGVFWLGLIPICVLWWRAAGKEERRKAAAVAAEGSPFSAAKLIDRFHEQTGLQLQLSGTTEMGGDRLAVLEGSKEAQARLGGFAFFVELTPAEQRSHSEKLQPRGVAASEHPDADGLYWTEEHPERGRDRQPYWVATTVRGNVQLNWYPPSRTRGATDQLETLRDVLDGLEDADDLGLLSPSP
jgi:hypothetical protein